VLRFLAGIAVLTLALGTGACESGSDPVAAGGDTDPAGGDGELSAADSYLGLVDHGCRKVRAESGPDRCRVVLDRVVFDGEVLTLHTRIDTWCCAAFEAGAVTTADTLDLQVVNVGHKCRCLCTYDVEFSFLWASSGDVALTIDFASWESCSLDTVITVQ
jgi:hypothetical protein